MSRFYDRPDNCYLVNDIKAVADYCREFWPEEVTHILRIADEVCRKEFLFDLKWDMERTYEPVVFKDEIDWFFKPGDDPEFIFQFNRHRFFMCLGQAYALTGDEKYAKCFVDCVTDWIEKSKLCEENYWTTWRTIEAGLRAEYWTRAFRYFKDSSLVTEEIEKTFAASLKEHAEFIIEKHDILRRMSNWSILEDHGLFEIGCFLPQDEDTERYIDTALRQLAIEVRLQVFPDGSQWEQSPMYHNEVLHCLNDVVLYARKNRLAEKRSEYAEYLGIIEAAAKRLAYADAFWRKPDGCQFINGDSDDTDVRDMISLGAYLYADPVLKYLGYKKLDFDDAWDLGIEGINAYDAIEPAAPDFVSKAMTDSGNYYLRSDWGEDANLMHFHCGTIGAGHGHSDQLHVDLVINGEDVLTDSGRYNYVAGPDRYEFKNPEAHNTITVDGKMFTVCHDSWRCSKLSQPVNRTHNFGEKYEFVQGGHLGYMENEGVFVNRKIIHIKPDIYIICDEMYTNGEHTYQQYFNFNNYGTTVLTAAGGELTNVELAQDCPTRESIEFRENIVHPEVKAAKAVFTGSKGETELYFMAPGLKSTVHSSRISRNYNQTEERPTVCNEFSGKGFCSAFTVVYAKNGSDDKLQIKKLPVKSVFNKEIHPSYYAEALQLTVGERDYVVIVCHQEVNSPTDQTGAADCMGFGNVQVFDRNKERQPGTVLLY